MSPPKKSTSSIESKLNDLEKILEELESGNLELDESLKKFEKGVKLSRECQKTLEEAELKSTDDTGSVIRCKNQPLDSEEISIHLDAGKLVQKVAFEYAETLTAIMCEDGAIKRIKFTDRIKEETDDVPKDQVEARLDAEFALMSAEICTLLNFLRGALNLNDDSL